MIYTISFILSYPSIEIVCGKCGSVINKIISLKSIKDVLRPTNGRCRICGNALNPSEFTIDLEKAALDETFETRMQFIWIFREYQLGRIRGKYHQVCQLCSKLFLQNIQSKCFDLQ